MRKARGRNAGRGGGASRPPGDHRQVKGKRRFLVVVRQGRGRSGISQRQVGQQVRLGFALQDSPVCGISTGEPRVEGVFDAACNQLDETFNVLPLQHTLDRLDAVGRHYRAEN